MSKFWRQEDNWLKLLSLLVALIIWVYVASRTAPPAEVGWQMDVPLQARGVPDGMVVTGAPPTIKVSLVAAPGKADEVKSQVKAILPAEGLGPGHYRLAVRVPQPANGRVVGVSPRWVEIDIGRSATRLMRVTVETSGEPAAGFRAEAPGKPVPEGVVLTGLESLLERVAAVRARVDLAGASGEMEVTVPAVPVDSEGNPVAGVTADPAEVRVHVAVPPFGE